MEKKNLTSEILKMLIFFIVQNYLFFIENDGIFLFLYFVNFRYFSEIMNLPGELASQRHGFRFHQHFQYF